MSINIHIEKKDLWLLAAIEIFLVGVGYVIAYGGTQPTVHGHSAGEIEGGGINSYDSGWFAVVGESAGNPAEYTVTHNLGTINIITDILFAPDSGGAPDLTRIYKVDRIESGGWFQGASIKSITNTNLIVDIDRLVFSSWTSGWYKVIAISVD